jgi:alkylation response protein AidB-like acyl-CoA dehydrogenase
MLEEFSRFASYIFGLLASGGGGLTPIAIARHGTDEQRGKYLPGLIGGTLRTAFALTEPAAGSDNSAMTTRADKVADGWAINGPETLHQRRTRGGFHYGNGRHRPAETHARWRYCVFW